MQENNILFQNQFGFRKNNSTTFSLIEITEKIKETIDRKKVWFAQTPQTFQKTKLIQALNMAKRRNLVVTDESTLMEHMGFSIGLVKGHANNFKITTKEDWERAENLIKWSEQE